MTTWGGNEVRRYAIEAGFTANETLPAVVCAFVSSAFADHVVTQAGDAQLVGLFGVPAHSDEDAAATGPGSLLDPRVSARALRALYVANGRTWDWHPLMSALGPAGIAKGAQRLASAGLLDASATTMPTPSRPGGVSRVIMGARRLMRDAGPIGPLSERVPTWPRPTE